MNPVATDATLPHDLDAERSVLGATLLHPAKVLPRVAPIVGEGEGFYHPAHVAVWRAALDCDRSQVPVDVITVAEAMRKAETFGRLAALEGEAYLFRLVDSVVTVDNVEHYARIVVDKHELRRLVELAVELRGMAMRPGATSADVRERAEQALVDLRAAQVDKGPRQIEAGLVATLREIEARYEAHRNGTKISTVAIAPTGFPALDRVLGGGFRVGNQVVIGARPAVGKSALAMNIVRNVAKYHGVPSLVFSLEMEECELDERLISSEAGVDAMRLASGQMDADRLRNAHRAVSALSKLPISVDDTGGLKLAQIRARARRWRLRDAPVDKHPIAVIAVDYLQLIGTDMQRGSNREQEVAAVSRGLKALAKELRCVVISLAQVGRECEKRSDKRPGLADLRESGGIEADADVVAFLYREHVYNPTSINARDAEFIIAKQRKGPTVTVPMRWIAEHQLFVPEED